MYSYMTSEELEEMMMLSSCQSISVNTFPALVSWIQTDTL